MTAYPKDPDSLPLDIGEKIEEAVRTPGREQVAPGIWRNPDGKLETDLPLPSEKQPRLDWIELLEQIGFNVVVLG